MTDTVLVTGGLGRSGRWIVDRLAPEHRVHCVDVDHPGYEVDASENVTFAAADLTEAGETLALVDSVDPDAVVHWAAIPTPERHAGPRVFETNGTATYNVLSAAGRGGADVVQAASEASYGLAFADEPRLPAALPITVDHPQEPADPYGLGKVVAEETAEAVVRRDGIAVTSVRPSWIQYPGAYECRPVDDLAAGAGNCWSYVDARDVAELVAAAVADPPTGHEPVHAAAADSYLDRPTADAVRECFGDLPADCSLSGRESALSTERARALFGWTPTHEWETAATASVASPTLWE